MSQMHQGNPDAGTLRGRGRLSAMSRRAAAYFVEEPDARRASAAAGDDGTVEFAPDFLGDGGGPRTGTVVLPLTRSGAYERAAVDARLDELERELEVARAAASTPSGVEAEIQYLGEETAEILRLAHQKAENLVARATEEASGLRAAARADAEAVRLAAEQRLRQLDIETDQIWAERTRLTDDTLRLSEALRKIAEGALERFPAAAAPAVGLGESPLGVPYPQGQSEPATWPAYPLGHR